MEPVLRDPEDRAPPALNTVVLEEIFVRIDAPADLACISAACKEFYRLITAPHFRRRYRSLHPLLLLGFLHQYHQPGYFVPAAAPHPSAPTAEALDAAAPGFSFGYLPPRVGPWRPCDARHGRVLLRFPGFKPDPDWDGDLVLPELAVTDPLTLKTALLPPIPNSLFAASLVPIKKQIIHFIHLDVFFDPSEDYNQAGFRVLWWSATFGTVYVYSSVSGTWTYGASTAMNLRQPGYLTHYIPGPCPGFVSYARRQPGYLTHYIPGPCPGIISYARGCLYRKPDDTNKLIKLNLNRMQFSVVKLPPHYKNEDVVVSEAGEGRIGIFSLIRGPGNPPIYSIMQRNEAQNAVEGPVETAIPLPDEYHGYFIASAAEGYIFIVGYRNSDPVAITAFFSLETKTMKLEKVCLSRGIPYHIIPYFGYAPYRRKECQAMQD